jgi:cytochrome c biogenesis protein CcmG/thiol:disulfide interchange protein DsbE
MGSERLVKPSQEGAVSAARRRPNQRLWVLGAVLLPVLLLLALLAWALVRTGAKPGGFAINNVFGEVPIKPGPAREFTLTLMDGTVLALADLRGKAVMIDFWSSWCPPCREEAPTLDRVYKEYVGKGMEFVGVAIWDTEEEVAKFIKRYGVSYPNGLDLKGQITIDYGVTGIPEKYFVDRSGQLVRKFVGPVTADQLRQALDALLAR